MSYAITVRCDVCRVEGLEVGFDAPEETIVDLLAAVRLDGGWKIEGDFSKPSPESFSFECPKCQGMPNREGVALARASLVNALEARAGEEVGARAEAFREARRAIYLYHGETETFVAFPRIFLYRRSGGEIVPVDLLSSVATRFVAPSAPDSARFFEVPSNRDHVMVIVRLS